MASRRDQRLRREYLYRKSLEGKERAVYERKALVKDALAQGKSLPTELHKEVGDLRHAISLDDEGTLLEQQRTHIDDEYARAGEIDPKICITTSHGPSSRLKQFAAELRLVFPTAQRINRGGTKVGDLVDACKRNDFTDIIIAHETRGEPDALVVCHLPFGPTAFFSLSGCVLRHDIEGTVSVSEAYPHLVLDNFTTALGERTSNILRYLFPVPKPDSRRIITFANDRNYISFRHHTYETEAGAEPGDAEAVQLHEVGPRFEMQLYQVRLGTIDQPEAENEWTLRPFMSTAKKRKVM